MKRQGGLDTRLCLPNTTSGNTDDEVQSASLKADNGQSIEQPDADAFGGLKLVAAENLAGSKRIRRYLIEIMGAKGMSVFTAADWSDGTGACQSLRSAAQRSA
jgi:hypothetical protein